MATFDQTIPISYDTRLTMLSAKSVVMFDDNSHIIHSLSANDTVKSGKIICPFLTLAQKDIVMNFYAANKDITWQFVNPHDGATYDLEFIDPIPTPIIDRKYTPDRYIIYLNVVGQKQ